MSSRIDSTLLLVMMFVMSWPCFMRSEALHDWVMVIFRFPAPEYPIAITLMNWGTPFFSSILFTFFLASIPFGLSSVGIGGCTWMIRHHGSVVGS